MYQGLHKNLFVLCLAGVFLAGCQTTDHLVDVRDDGDSLEQLVPGEMSFDLDSGEVRYVLPEPAYVRVRIGLDRGGALLRTLVDWERRPAGANVERWDKTDDTGTVDFGQYRNVIAVLAAYPVQAGEKYLKLHGIRGLRKAPRIEMELPETEKQTAAGVPVVSGRTPVRVTIDKDDYQWLTESRFEVMIYIDQAFLVEDEQGTNPFTYYVETGVFNNGMHTFTVNVAGFMGEVGTHSLKVYVNN